MLVVRVGPDVRRWLLVAATCGLLLGVLRWGLSGPGPDLARGLGSAPAARLPVKERVVALTVDATAADRLAPVAEALEAAGVPCTFFVDAGYARAHGAPLRDLVRVGDEVDLLADTAADTTAGGLARDARVLGAAAGSPPLFVRPVSGRASPALQAAARRVGLGVATWARDLSAAGAAAAQALEPGDIVRLPPGSAGAALVPALVRELQQQGLQPVTLEAMVAMAEGAAAAALPTLP
jgi:peptidoglycan/xylan/chitin deacetylase (PgdA/CDA1 family)